MPRVPGADAIDEHADLDAAFGRAAERGSEESARGVIVEDIGSHADAAGGGVDRGEHLRVGVVATDERLDRIAFNERPACHLADERGQRPQRSVVGADGGIELLS